MQSSPTNDDPYTRLTAFRRSHALVERPCAGHTWNFIDCGSGPSTAVLLPGGGGSAESQFLLISALEPHSRVLSIGCPSTVTTIQSVVRGLEELLDERGVSACFLLGHSLGGLFAEALAMSCPERIGGLILANIARYAPRRARMIRGVLETARYLPHRAVVALLTARINRLLRGHPHRRFWLDYFTHDELRRIGRDGIANRGACIVDAIEHWPAVAERPYLGPVLIVESNNETGFTAAERKAFRAYYPQAQIEVLSGAGHLSSITRPGEFANAVLSFMARSQSPALR